MVAQDGVMCGRFVLKITEAELREIFKLPKLAEPLPTSFNVAPSQDVVAVTAEDDPHALETFRWGLVPFWAKDDKIGNRMINARSETADTSGAFKHALARRRCVIPASGFYEWKQAPGGKQPVYIHPRTGEPLLMAGLYETWQPEGRDAALRTCTILTTAANETISSLHDRMPCLLGADEVAPWLDLAGTSAAEAKALLQPAPGDWLDYYEVSKAVNSPRHDDPSLIEPLPENPELNLGM